MSSESQIHILAWDWRAQPDLHQLATLIRDLSEGKVNLREIETGSDEYAIALSDVPLSKEEAEHAYEHRHEDEDEQ